VFKTVSLVIAISALVACSGEGAGTAPDTSGALQSTAWGATFRYQPASLTLSLASPAMQFFYLDAMPINGVVPSSQAFLNDFTSANPGITTSSRSAIAILSVAPIAPDSYSGRRQPTMVTSAYPDSTGTRTQTADTGTGGSRQFSLSVTP
jgi:hypothetical protein